MWEMQREPFKGDVINSYNDGPPAPGKPPLGPFYELETSSPALSLRPTSSIPTSIAPSIWSVPQEISIASRARRSASGSMTSGRRLSNEKRHENE